jgi:pimeloyl-ACP methyl ester carboxylesterase
MAPRPARAPALVIAILALALPLLSAARCYPPGTRVVVFVQGLYTTLDADGTQGTLVEDHRFERMKAAFRAGGYGRDALLDFSYNGGAVDVGTWDPEPYQCEDTDRLLAANVATLDSMLADYKAEHDDAHFALVGHSLGGVVAFLTGARDAARPDDEKLGVDVVVTLDAPLHGVSADKKIILDFVSCEKTWRAGADFVAMRLDPSTADVRRYQAAVMAQQGVRLATLGNTRDCLLNTRACIGGEWVDDGFSQFLDSAAFLRDYAIQADPLASHDIIVGYAPAITDTVSFVGKP